jgi:phage terminase small subunit
MTILTAKERAAEALSKLTDRGKPAAEPEPEQPPPEQQLIRPGEPEPARSIPEVGPMDLEQHEPGDAYGALNDRQRIFVDGLVAGKSQSDAVRAAGYSDVRPDIAGSRLMRDDTVRRAVEERRAEAAKAAGLDAHKLLVRMAGIAMGDIAVDSDVVMMRALENSLKYLQTPGKGGESSVAQKINDRYQKARLKALPRPATTTKH